MECHPTKKPDVRNGNWWALQLTVNLVDRELMRYKEVRNQHIVGFSSWPSIGNFDDLGS